MGIILTATENEVYKKGIYPLRVQAIEPKVSKLAKPDGTTEESTYLRWTFDILKRGFEGKTISANSSIAFGPSSKGRKWAEALLDRQFHVNEPVDTDDLVGHTAMATIGIIKKGENQYNEIEALAPMDAQDAPEPVVQRTTQRAQQAQHGGAAVPRTQMDGYPHDDDDVDF